MRHIAKSLQLNRKRHVLGTKFSSKLYSTLGISDGLVGAIGNTPLIRLRRISEQTGCTILAKAEYLNPGGSIKDRAAWGIIKDAEDKGLLKTGGTVVEGTAGNTGIGMAHVCKSRGYKLVIYMPDTQSPEKISALRTLGATVYPVPAVPFDNPSNYNHQARKYAESTPNCIWGNQFDNVANKAYHVATTGPEIWAQTGGKIDGWVAATGTGGTFAGVSEFLKSKNTRIQCYVADPPGSVLYSYITTGKMERSGSSITEGIGQGRITENMKGAKWDGAFFIDDRRTIRMLFDLFHTEGFLVGASSALNIVAAQDLAKKLGPGHTIVTVLCDTASNYKSRLLSQRWLQSKGLFNEIPTEYHNMLTQ